MSKNIDWNAVKEKANALGRASDRLRFRLDYVKNTEAPAAVEAERDKFLAEILALADELRQLTAPEDEPTCSVVHGHIPLSSIDSAVLAKTLLSKPSVVADSDEEAEIERRVKFQLREARINAEVQRRLEEAGE